MNVTSLRSEAGEVESVVITLQDMTPLEELERLRAEFLGMVSHELRAPLTSIKGSAATLIGSGESLDPAESAVLVDRARNAVLSAGGRSNIQIDLELDLPRVMADRRRIVQVLGNLLTNAARHSPESSAIRVSAVREGAHVAFSVADDGVGVSAELLPYLFRKHSRIEGDDRSGIAGSGVGLAICKGIVEVHGGRIRAESEGAGMGARFTFTLPVAGEAGHAPAAGAARTPSRSGRSGQGRTRVLVVDDDPQTLRYVRDALSEGDFTAIVTADPEEVERLMEEEKPHLVLLDLMLPGTDGIELMERVPALGGVPVIFISAYGRDQLVTRALEAGAGDYIVKPFSPTELVARIQTALPRQSGPEPEEPAGPYVLGDLTNDYAERRVYLGGCTVRLTDIEYRFLFELSVNAGRVLTFDRLLQRVW